jgi:predicted O-methyltransferase YrrM
MDLLPLLKYIKYFLFSRHSGGHGIHSPFVFSLVSGTFRNKIEPDVVCSIEAIRRKMISNPETMVVNDLGAGSKKMKSSLRKVSDIAKYSAVPKKYGIFLANLSKAFAGPYVLEFGTSLGISTMYMAAACPGSEVYTMEGCPRTSAVASENFREAGLSNIRMFIGPFDELLQEIKAKGISPGLVFIDGITVKIP